LLEDIPWVATPLKHMKKMTPIIYYVVLKKKIGPQVLYPHILVIVDPHGCFVGDPNFTFILPDI